MPFNTQEILRAARDRGELTSLETLILLKSEPAQLPELMEAAASSCLKVHGREATYVRAKKIHFTNVCRARCRICSFYKARGQSGSFTLTPEEVLTQIRRSREITQVTLTGGLNPDLTLKHHMRFLSMIKEYDPDLKIEGYAPNEVLFLARRARIHYRQVLRQLKSAGLDLLTGDAGGILNDKIRKKIFSDKMRTNDWIEIIRAAHSMEIPTTATVLVGHVENEVYLSEHLDILKRLQKETGFFTSVEIIPFLPDGAAAATDPRVNLMTRERLLKTVAIVRLTLGDTFRNVTVSWIKVGLPLAIECLKAGANDLGGLYFDEFEIRPRALSGAITLSIPAVQAAIQKAGRIPVERKPYSVRKPRYAIGLNTVAMDPVYIRNF